MISLSRNGIVSSTVMPGSPSVSRIRAAGTMSGSHRHSTRSMRACAEILRASPRSASSSANPGTCTYAERARRVFSGSAAFG